MDLLLFTILTISNYFQLFPTISNYFQLFPTILTNSDYFDYLSPKIVRISKNQ